MYFSESYDWMKLQVAWFLLKVCIAFYVVLLALYFWPYSLTALALFGLWKLWQRRSA